MRASLVPFELALSTPLETSAGTIHERTGWVLRIGEDTVGIGEATPLPGFTESVDACEAAITDVVSAVRDERWPGAFASVSDAPAARHALTTALLDRRARETEQPLYRQLGGRQLVESIPVHATVGAAGPDESVARATEAVGSGFETLKLKVGTRPLDADLDRIAAVREAVGPDVDIRVDANGAWDRSTASRALDGLAESDVSLVEQPVPASDLTTLHDLRGRIPIAADESVVEMGAGAVLEAGAADVLVLKPMALGGLDAARGIAHRARRRGLSVLVSNTIDGAVARTGTVHLAASLPDRTVAGLATASMLETDLAVDPSPITDGAMPVPQTPGLGIEEVTVDA